MQIREFRLSPRGRGVSCDADGVFVGLVALLDRRDAPGRETWAPRECKKLSGLLSRQFGIPVDLSSKSGGLRAIANALNEGDVARAQIAAVLLGIPDPPLSKSNRSSDETIQLIRNLHWSGLLKWDDVSSPSSRETVPDSAWPVEVEALLTKAGYDPDEPRDERGRWTNGGSASGSDDKPVDSSHEGFWESLATRLSDEAQSILTQAGQAELLESQATLAASTAEANTIVNDLEAYANYRAQPWIGPDGVPVQVPIINTGDPLSDRAALEGHDLFAPDAPLTRPGTNADWIDPLVDLSSAGAIVFGPAFEAADTGAVIADDAAELADAPFIILPSDLPAGFDPMLPIGRYVIPRDAAQGTTTYGILVGQQIGRILQGALPDVPMILRTAAGMRGVDIEIAVDDSSLVGFQYAEIKPVSKYGFGSFTSQIARWKLPAPVQAITYDYQGNIYYGFPW